MKSLRLFLGLVREAPLPAVAGLVILMVLVSLSEGVGLLLLVPLLETLQNGRGSGNALVQSLLRGLAQLGVAPSLGGLLGAFVLLVAFRAGVQFAREVVASRVQHDLVDRLRQRCFAALLQAEWRWMAAGSRANHANLLLTDVTRVGVGLHFGLGLGATLTAMGAYVLAAFALSWQTTALALAGGGLVLSLLSGQRRKALHFGQSLGEANRAIQANVQESLAGIKLAKILGSEERHLGAFRQVMARLREQHLRFLASTSLSRALLQVGGGGLLAAYLYLGLTQLEIPVAELMTLILVFGRLIPMFSSAQQQYHHWLHALPAVAETRRLLDECRQFAEPGEAMAGEPWPVKTAITLGGATVRHEGRDRPALDKVSVSFPVRTTTAVMGPSGAGKTTLADVLMGLLALDEGNLAIDGEAVTGAGRRRWRRSVAYVPQETFLFNDSIRNNLLWGHPQAGEEELRQALARAAADFVFTLPEGMDTVVGDGGLRLSGGERQRLALARALLKKPSLLILDEATSALDRENENRVRRAIENLHGDLTVVIIGHRLATLEHADQVLVLNQGRIAACGPWTEVRNRDGVAA